MNKTRFFCLFLLLFVTASLKAQIFLGPKGGVNLYKGVWLNFSASDEWQTPMLLGYNAGVAMQIRIGNVFYIQPEVLIVRRGFKMTWDNLLFNTLEEYEYRVKTVQVLSHFGWAYKTGDFRGFVFVGPSVGLAIGGKEYLYAVEKTTGEVMENTIERCFACFSQDYSLLVGLGASYDVGPGAVQFDIRLTPTISAWYNQNTNDEINSIAAYSIEMSLAYLFRLSKRRDRD